MQKLMHDTPRKYKHVILFMVRVVIHELVVWSKRDKNGLDAFTYTLSSLFMCILHDSI